MKNMKFFYVIETQLQDVGMDTMETTGWNTVTVYQINGDNMEKFCAIECLCTEDTNEAILAYLDDNGHGDELNTVQLIQL